MKAISQPVMKPISVEIQDVDVNVDQRSQALAVAASTTKAQRLHRWLKLLFFFTCVLVGMIGGPLTQRLYYVHGGDRKWLSCTMQSIGFPVLLIPLSLLYFRSRGSHLCVVKCASNQNRKSITTHHHHDYHFFLLDPKPLGLAALMGLILGLSNYLYATGLMYLPVSTSSLLFSSQLAFTAVFARVLVRQRFTFYSANAVVVMTMGAAVLGMQGGGGGGRGGDKGRYVEGFAVTLGGAATSGLVLPMVEVVYRKCGRVVNLGLVTQVQIVMNVFASLFCVVGMALHKDFQNIPREAKDYGLGEVKYYIVLVGCSICWQLCFVGIAGIILCASSLFAGVTAAFMLPFQEVAAVIVFHEKFNGEKGLSLGLCLWGFISYFIGEYKKTHVSSSGEATTSPKISTNDGDNV